MAALKTKSTEALARELGRAHAALLHDLAMLKAAAQPESFTSRDELRDRLATIKSHLAAHFRFEEQGGYMDAIRKREPRLIHTIDELAADHQRLSTSLEAIARDASLSLRDNEELRQRIREWIDDLARHELRENDVVQDAFNSDITGED